MTDFEHGEKVYDVRGTGEPTVTGSADFTCAGCGRVDLDQPILQCGCGCERPMTRICQTCEKPMVPSGRA